MSGRTNRDRLGREVQPRVEELRARLVEWDVLGVYQDDEGPDDDNEYDDLLGPILTWLAEDADAQRLSARIEQFLERDYGIGGGDQTRFAQSLVEWWQSPSS